MEISDLRGIDHRDERYGGAHPLDHLHPASTLEVDHSGLSALEGALELKN